jgi:thioredoxin 1
MDELDITTETIDQYILQDQVPFIVDFWAPWSTPCLLYKSYIEEANELLHEKALFGAVNIDENQQLADRFSIMTIPTTLVFWQGQIVKQFIGIQEKETFAAAIAELTSQQTSTTETVNA